MMSRFLAVPISLLLSCACSAQDNPFSIEEIATFDEPWAMTFLPDGRMLVTEKKGSLRIVTQEGEKSGAIRGLPDVDYAGQGGFGDIALHPDYDDNGWVYMSYAETGVGDTRGAAVARGQLSGTGRSVRMTNVEVIWRQYPKLVGYGHYGHRIAFDDDGYLWISSGDRQKFTPSQDMQSTVGKMVRLHDDGSIPDDNPFVDHFDNEPLVDDIGVYNQIWSLGHRNPLGIAFDLDGNLWEIEMGPAGGDELNFIKKGANYGYPTVSNGEHYDGRPMPDHDTRPEFEEPAIWWTPTISPGNLMIYKGDLFDGWRGDAFAAGLSSRAIVHIKLDGEEASEYARYEMGERIRSVIEGPNGALWVLEDELRDRGGRLLKLTPKQ